MCAQVITTWCLIEQATGRPKRVPPWMMEMFG
jgi:acyl-CoA thioester hydrolase